MSHEKASEAAASLTTGAARIELSNEWHARPGLRMATPFRCSHVVELSGDESLEASRAEFASFCAEFGRSGPAESARHHLVEIGSSRMKWERRTEATSHTIFVPGNGQPPFSETAIDFISEPRRKSLVENMFIGVQIEVLEPPGPDDPHGSRLARSLLGADTVYGGRMSAGTCAVWSAFELDARGFQRILVFTLEKNEERVCRLVQRLLDLETYRILAILALPTAREVMGMLGRLDPELDEVMSGLAQKPDERIQEQSLARITALAARAEHIVAAHAYRFAAARAYAGIVERRCTEVDEQVLEDHERYTSFLSRSLTPAMRTSDAAERRTEDFARRVSRAARLLDTMVDMVQKKQNQVMLESLTQRARMQLQLQQAVEGFSIFAISYYAIGLLAYGLKAAKAAGLGVDPDLLAGAAAPFVLAGVWWTVRMVRRKLRRGTSAEDRL